MVTCSLSLLLRAATTMSNWLKHPSSSFHFKPPFLRLWAKPDSNQFTVVANHEPKHLIRCCFPVSPCLSRHPMAQFTVRLTGFEPATSWTQTKRATRLRYNRKKQPPRRIHVWRLLKAPLPSVDVEVLGFEPKYMRVLAPVIIHVCVRLQAKRKTF